MCKTTSRRSFSPGFRFTVLVLLLPLQVWRSEAAQLIIPMFIILMLLLLLLHNLILGRKNFRGEAGFYGAKKAEQHFFQ